jgi:phage regulator Rha-like protein
MINKTEMLNIVKPLELHLIENEIKVDSRIIAKRLGIEHNSLIKNIEKYINEFQILGSINFQTISSSKAGQPLKFVYLDEDQAIFALTLSKNTIQVVQLKLDLTIAYKNSRLYQKMMVEFLQNQQIFNNNITQSIVNLQTEIVEIKNYILNSNILLNKEIKTYTLSEVAKEFNFKKSVIIAILRYLNVITDNSPYQLKEKYINENKYFINKPNTIHFTKEGIKLFKDNFTTVADMIKKL